MKSKKEIIQSVEYIFENTKRIHGNSEAIDWQKVAIHKSVEYILSLPLDVPTDEEIESRCDDIANPESKKDFVRGEWLGHKEGAKWAIEEIKRRNQK